MVGVIESDGTTERVTTDESTSALSRPAAARPSVKAADIIREMEGRDRGESSGQQACRGEAEGEGRG